MRLDVSGIDVAHGSTQVLFDVSMHAESGELVCIMGRNGVGKSTLLNATMGLLPLRRGSVDADGASLVGRPTHQRAREGIGYVPQGHVGFPHLTTMENLRVVQERGRGIPTGAVDEALDWFPALRGLIHRPAGLLSGGQAQQLAIARALVSRPRLLLLDEPTEGIQPSIILEIEDTIADLHRSTGMTIVLVEQYVEFALRLSQRYYVMEAGRVVDHGSTAAVDPSQLSDLLAV